MRPIDIKKNKRNWKKIFTIIIILLFLGVVLAIALVDIDFVDILRKIP